MMEVHWELQDCMLLDEVGSGFSLFRAEWHLKAESGEREHRKVTFNFTLKIMFSHLIVLPSQSVTTCFHS